MLVTALGLLLDGGPVPTSEVAERLNLTDDEVTSALERLPDAEFDPEGRFLGYGLTLRRTLHQFRVQDRTLYTWCAWDALVLPPLLDRPAEIRSPCPASGATVRMRVTPRVVVALVPETAVVSLVPPTGGDACRSVRASFCRHVHFFRSAEEADRWLEGRAEAAVIPVKEAFAAARRLEC